MEQLCALQKLALETKPLTAAHQAEILKLREQVPAPVLGHFDRLIARGKKGVAIARNGACSECHLRLASGTMAALAKTGEIHICDNCGRYLYLPEEKPASANDSPAPTKVPAKSRPRRIRRNLDLHHV